MLDECERICSPQSCLQEVLLKFHRWPHSQKGFYCIFPSPINPLYLHLCVGKYDCCCCLAQGRSHLEFVSKWVARSLQAEGYELCLCKLCAYFTLKMNRYSVHSFKVSAVNNYEEFKCCHLLISQHTVTTEYTTLKDMKHNSLSFVHEYKSCI